MTVNLERSPYSISNGPETVMSEGCMEIEAAVKVCDMLCDFIDYIEDTEGSLIDKVKAMFLADFVGCHLPEKGVAIDDIFAFVVNALENANWYYINNTADEGDASALIKAWSNQLSIHRSESAVSPSEVDEVT